MNKKQKYKLINKLGKGFLACKGNLNIRIHRDITGEMWFGVGLGYIMGRMENLFD
jgi:hypothetical protein